jgi:PPM family protein phosphatase
MWPGPSTASAPLDVPADDGWLIAVLADGMGGHAGGTLASRVACEYFLATYANETKATPVRDRLRSGLNSANRAIAFEVDLNRTLNGMGTTLIGTAFGPEGLEWISVGDSPLYLWRAGEIALVNEDHSLAPLLDEMARIGKITAEEARCDQRRHMLRSAVTGEDFELVDLSAKPLRLEAGDCVLLSSDGIHTLETTEIARLVTAYGKDGPQAIADALIRGVESLRDPHQDNFTVAVVQVSAGPVTS